MDWLTARPIAHRGLHTASEGIIENMPSAFTAAIGGNYAIECDVQCSADGEAMVHHDGVLDRLTETTGPLGGRTVAELKRVTFKNTADRMLTLGELCDLVADRVTLIVEIKHQQDAKSPLPKRVADVLSGYKGPVATMSFDPNQIAAVREQAPNLVRGIVAERNFHPKDWGPMSGWERFRLAHLLHAPTSKLQFVSYRVSDLPAPAPTLARALFGIPLICWTVRTPEDRARAEACKAQITFEGFRA
jgi:glycerophosphoryl diester phosphodiesterase